MPKPGIAGNEVQSDRRAWHALKAPGIYAKFLLASATFSLVIYFTNESLTTSLAYGLAALVLMQTGYVAGVIYLVQVEKGGKKRLPSGVQLGTDREFASVEVDIETDDGLRKVQS
jgi:hypothetical protein